MSELENAASELGKALLKELEELRKWKAEAISVSPPLQEIGQELGLTIGESINDKILPELIRRREAIDWQNMPNRREPLRGGYEFYINEEWTCIRDAVLGEDPGFRASLLKVRYDPDDERVRIRRVLDDDAILLDLAAAKEHVEDCYSLSEERAGYLQDAELEVRELRTELVDWKTAYRELVMALRDAAKLIDDAGHEDETTWRPGQSWIFREDMEHAKAVVTRVRDALVKHQLEGLKS